MMKDSDHSKWFVASRRSSWSELRLICLPYAGGSAATYMSWQKSLPGQVELIAVQPPGRADRISEPAYRSMDKLMDALYPKIAAHLDKPYVLLGHSLGARIGFELIRRLDADNSRLPEHFIASGSPAPNVNRQEMIYTKSDAEFIEYLRQLGGSPEEVLGSAEMMELFAPSIRADFQLAETYFSAPGKPIDCRLSIFAGELDDQVLSGDLLAWRDYFSFGGDMSIFSGKHFFIEEDRREVIQKVNDILYQAIASMGCRGFKGVAEGGI